MIAMAPADNDTQRAIGRIEGKHTGASKGGKPPPKPKVKPVIKKNTFGFKVTRNF